MKAIEILRNKAPIIHCMTNAVSINDCANILLACGASPIMADSIEDAEDICSIADALVLNLGMLNPMKAEAMLLAGKTANKKNIPIVLDPVGIGASTFRQKWANKLLAELKISLIRGNTSEISFLASGKRGTRGVDSDITEEKTGSQIEKVQECAEKYSCIAAASGKTDILSDGKKIILIHNGCDEMRLVTGAGCMLSVLSAAHLAANKENTFFAAAAAFTQMGIAGEIAQKNLKENEGSASFRIRMIDAICHIDDEMMRKGANYEILA